ncbi:MAG: hypothetical protein SFY67_12300 [Candidatus Melainabacteria bacterium]|nr:hypothetical protein [Candidatus Melainabacteria bacterium]
MKNRKLSLLVLSLMLCQSLLLQAGSVFAQEAEIPDNLLEDPPTLQSQEAKIDTGTTASGDQTENQLAEAISPGESTKMLQGGVTYCVPKGTPLKLKLALVPTMGMRLADRDLEGNLHPAREGQKITAKTTEDIFIENNRVIPEGTTLYGLVSKVHGQRRVGRDTFYEIAFKTLELPDGRKFAFTAEADNFKPSTLKTKAKGFGLIAAHAAGGAVLGAIFAYQICGMSSTISMHGYNIAGGAAAGALLATGFAIMRKGPKATLEPGDDLNLRIDTDLLMPMTVEPKPKKAPPAIAGLKIDIENVKSVKDGVDGKLMKMDVAIDNQTAKRFYSIDLFLEDSNGNRDSLSSGGGFDSEISFTVEPNSYNKKRLYFTMEWPKLKHRLVWIDHKTRQPIHTMNWF